MRKLVPIVLLLLLAACGSRRGGDVGGGGAISHVRVLARALDAQRELNTGAVAFDLRDYNHWAQGHLPGARSLTLDDLRAGRGLPDDLNAPLLFYGEGAMDSRAEDAAELAASRGYQRVLYFPGGWRAWSGQSATD